MTLRMFSGQWLKWRILPVILGMAIACNSTPPPKPLRSGVIPLKVATLTLGQNVRGCIVGPLDGSAFDPPDYPTHSTYVVPFDPKLPLPRAFRVIWTEFDGAFRSYVSGGSGRAHQQINLNEWGHDLYVTLSGPIPERAEHLLLIFTMKGEIRAEVLSEAQMESGHMERRAQEFLKTRPKTYSTLLEAQAEGQP